MSLLMVGAYCHGEGKSGSAAQFSLDTWEQVHDYCEVETTDNGISLKKLAKTAALAIMLVALSPVVLWALFVFAIFFSWGGLRQPARSPAGVTNRPGAICMPTSGKILAKAQLSTRKSVKRDFSNVQVLNFPARSPEFSYCCEATTSAACPRASA